MSLARRAERRFVEGSEVGTFVSMGTVTSKGIELACINSGVRIKASTMSSVLVRSVLEPYTAISVSLLVATVTFIKRCSEAAFRVE